ERQDNLFRIIQLGSAPILMRQPLGTIVFHRPDATKCRVTALDANGYPIKTLGNAKHISLTPDTLYYLVTQ
ncbi:MAG: hypothetical protein ACK4I8_05410, partial [Armatimonadota bacterium]